MPEGVATADDVAVAEPAGFGVPVGEAELVGLAFGVGVDVVVGVGVGVGGDVVRAGAVEVEDCPEGLLTVAVCAGATSP